MFPKFAWTIMSMCDEMEGRRLALLVARGTMTTVVVFRTVLQRKLTGRSGSAEDSWRGSKRLVWVSWTSLQSQTTTPALTGLVESWRRFASYEEWIADGHGEQAGGQFEEPWNRGERFNCIWITRTARRELEKGRWNRDTSSVTVGAPGRVVEGEGDVVVVDEDHKANTKEKHILVSRRAHITREDPTALGSQRGVPGCALMRRPIARQACAESRRRRIEKELRGIVLAAAARRRTKGVFGRSGTQSDEEDEVCSRKRRTLAGRVERVDGRRP